MSFTESGTLAQSGAWDNSSGANYREDLRPAAGSGFAACFRITGLTLPNTALRYEAAQITIGVRSFAASFPDTLVLFARNEAAPAVWSDSLVPGFFTTSGATIVPSVRAQIGLNQVVELERQRFTSAPASITWSPDVGALNSIVARNGWAGVLQFHVLALNESGTLVEFDAETDASPFTLTLTVDTRNTTGLSSGYFPNSRTDLCPICGFTSFRERWVRDPERKILVCPRCADEENESRPTTRGERPPTHED